MVKVRVDDDNDVDNNYNSIETDCETDCEGKKTTSAILLLLLLHCLYTYRNLRWHVVWIKKGCLLNWIIE